MKLKLSEKDGFKLLAVSESLQAQEIPILHAGVLKILHTNTPGLIVDLSHCPVDAGILLQLRAETHMLSTPLLFVCATTGLGDATTIEEATAALHSPLRRLMLRENQLKQRIAAIEGLKKELEAKLAAQAAQWTDFLKLKHRVSDLKRNIGLLENILSAWITAGKLEGNSPRPPMPRAALLKQTLQAALASQGILKGA